MNPPAGPFPASGVVAHRGAAGAVAIATPCGRCPPIRPAAGDDHGAGRRPRCGQHPDISATVATDSRAHMSDNAGVER
jgi:hypothetical protein